MTIDGYKPYFKAVDTAFDEEIDFTQLVKFYGNAECEGNDKRYSSTEFAGTKKTIIEERPDEKAHFHVFCEKAKPDYEDAHKTLYADNQRLCQEDRKPLSRNLAALRLLQLLQNA